ncbi:Retrotransposon protein, Ty3-gypsy subclass [Gossypium australe]|uniref:Retrotransposon protein, Ty3-gypsy subclass n=1 Tax=Gossypium australe TaxID=47621 RepID=A0A5B6VP21_9ROSI|nr:Retrotransposon protein, Ty3-gypsy subclass [Gossypium australe]
MLVWACHILKRCVGGSVDHQFVGCSLVRRIITSHLKIAQDHQKAYADRKRKDVSYEVGNKGKLSPRFIEPYKILERIKQVAYRSALSPELSRSMMYSIFQYCKDIALV